MDNLFRDLPASISNELVNVLVESGSVRVERIVSTGQRSPLDFWYDQKQHEWVVVLKGEARMQIEGEAEAVVLQSGDYINLPAHTRHRVASTSSEEPTVWLAIFYGP